MLLFIIWCWGQLSTKVNGHVTLNAVWSDPLDKGPALQPVSQINLAVRQSRAEPYIKYTIQGAQDGGPAAYLCNYLDNHGSLESTGCSRSARVGARGAHGDDEPAGGGAARVWAGWARGSPRTGGAAAPGAGLDD